MSIGKQTNKNVESSDISSESSELIKNKIEVVEDDKKELSKTKKMIETLNRKVKEAKSAMKKDEKENEATNGESDFFKKDLKDICEISSEEDGKDGIIKLKKIENEINENKIKEDKNVESLLESREEKIENSEENEIEVFALTRKSFIQNVAARIFTKIITKNTKRRFNEHKYTQKLHWENLHLKTTTGIIGLYLFYGCLNPNIQILIYLHGTGCDRKDVLNMLDVENLVYMDYIVCIPDYRGFGDSTGQFSRAENTRDMGDLITYLRQRFTYPINLVGHSLGTGVALEYLRYTSQSIVHKCVLLAPFKSLMSCIKATKMYKIASKLYHHLDKAFDEFNYDNLENIRYLEASKIIVCHGYRDKVVPMQEAQELVDYVSEFVRTPIDDHVSLVMNQEVWDIVNVFLRNEDDS